MTRCRILLRGIRSLYKTFHLVTVTLIYHARRFKDKAGEDDDGVDRDNNGGGGVLVVKRCRLDDLF